MKTNKALKRLAKVEALMSDVMERYSSSPKFREVLRDAQAAVARVKQAVSSQTASGKAKTPPVKHSAQPAKATPEPAKPKRRLSAAGRRAIIAATKKRWALQRAAAKARQIAAKKKSATNKAVVKVSPAKAAKGVKKTVAKKPQKVPAAVPAETVTVEAVAEQAVPALAAATFSGSDESVS